MSPLTANLKHFYQCRSFWFFNVFLLVWGVLVVLPPLTGWISPEDGTFTMYLSASLLAGYIAANMQRLVLTRPFSYCLPGHHQIPGRLLFRVGWGLSLLFSLVFFAYPGQTWPLALVRVASGAFLGMVCYLVGAVLTIYLPGKAVQQLYWIMILLCSLSLQLFKYIGVYVFFERIIVQHPLETIVTSGVFILLAWRWLSSSRVARAHCGEPFLALSDTWNRKKQEHVNRLWQKGRGSRQANGLDRIREAFFLKRMHGRPSLTLGRYCWGLAYNLAGKHLNRSLFLSFTLFLAFVIFFGYLRSAPRTPFSYYNWIQCYAFLMPAMVGLYLPLSISSSLLLPAGRRERFWGALMTGCVASGLLTSVAFCAAAATIGAEGIMPELEIRGRMLSFRSFDLWNAYLPFLLSPFLLAYQVGIARDSLLLRVPPFIVLVWAIPFGYDFFAKSGIGGVVLMPCAGWALFAWALFSVCSRKDLVDQGKG